jgi:hypothetical protein
MKIKSRTNYTAEIDGHEFEIPFPFEEGSEQLIIDGDTARLGVLVHDEDPSDPLAEYDGGELVQFDQGRKYGQTRPDLEDFKRVVRANHGQVVLIYGRQDESFLTADKALTVADTKGANCGASDIENADGYYIAPKDVTDAARYAKGAIAEYSAWCSGNVYGVCVWSYTLDGEEWALDEDGRDNECWGYYGYDYALETLKEEMK